MIGTLFAAALAAGTLSAASISGTVFDPSGAVVPQARITLSNPATGEKTSAETPATGTFSFNGLGPGQYLMQVEKPGFAPIFKALTLQTGTQVQRALLLQVGRMEESLSVTAQAGASTAAISNSPQRIRVGGNVQAANLVNKVQPVYPASAKAQRVQGEVLIRAFISKDGTPDELTVISTPSEDLANAALDAVRQWRYRPTLLNGEPVAVETEITISFTLLP